MGGLFGAVGGFVGWLLVGKCVTVVLVGCGEGKVGEGEDVGSLDRGILFPKPSPSRRLSARLAYGPFFNPDLCAWTCVSQTACTSACAGSSARSHIVGDDFQYSKVAWSQAQNQYKSQLSEPPTLFSCSGIIVPRTWLASSPAGEPSAWHDY